MNRQTFAERGIWLPTTLVPDPENGPYNHIFLSTASHLSIPKPDDIQSALGMSSMADVHRHRAEITNALAAEFAALPNPPATIIVSNEHIHSRLRDVSDLANAKAMLEPFCSEFRVVVYLRSQQTMAQSVAITALRNGALELRQVPDFGAENGFDPVLGVDFAYFDHASLLARLEDAFGADSLDVRLYEAEEMHEADIITDFFARLDVGIGSLPRPGRENTSLRPQAAMFLTKLNQYLPSHPNAEAIRERFLAGLAIAYPGCPLSAPQSEIADFLARFNASNEAVRARWFPKRQTLFPTPHDADSNQPMKYTEADLFNVFIEAFASIF
jgi:hypothetical protein